MPPRLILPLAAFTALFIFGTTAAADVPGPKPRCDAEGRGCTECWRPYGTNPDNQRAFETCRDAAKSKGLVEACHHRQGSGDAVFFCPAGVTVETKIVGGGCAGCTIDAAATPGTFAALAASLAAIALLRRRARR
jgi:MYXO-CTERM domain-containing protein